MAVITMMRASPPPLEALSPQTQEDLDFLAKMPCKGVKTPWYWYLRSWPTVESLSYNEDDILPLQNAMSVEGQVFRMDKPRYITLLSRANIEACNPLMKFRNPSTNVMKLFEWLNWSLGRTCGMGLGWAEAGQTPNLQLHILPESKMRGAIGWTWGPPLAKNRRMELINTMGSGGHTDYIALRLLQHEDGHHLGHYGTSAHSNRREDLMYPSIQNIKGKEPNWGKSERDLAWEKQKFGSPWITEVAA